jgi:hypothetical protein
MGITKKNPQMQLQVQWNTRNKAGVPDATWVTREAIQNPMHHLGWVINFQEPFLSKQSAMDEFSRCHNLIKSNAQHQKPSRKREGSG